MTDTRAAIVEFWNLFGQRAGELAATESADSDAYDTLLEQLQRIDPGLYFEFCAEPGASEIVITADGDRTLFALVELIVAQAPAVPGWTSVALKPKLGFPIEVRWEDTSIDISDVVFEPLENRKTGELGLRIFVAGLAETDVDSAHNAILRAIDHGLGERTFAEAIRFTDVRPLPPGDARDKHNPLTELGHYIDWRESKRGAPEAE